MPPVSWKDNDVASTLHDLVVWRAGVGLKGMSLPASAETSWASLLKTGNSHWSKRHVTLPSPRPPSPELLPTQQRMPASPCQHVSVKVGPGTATASAHAHVRDAHEASEGLLLEVVVTKDTGDPRPNHLQKLPAQSGLVHVRGRCTFLVPVDDIPDAGQRCIGTAGQFASGGVRTHRVSVLVQEAALPRLNIKSIESVGQDHRNAPIML
mmetsp:Transcript_11175/g.30892  ORF Transcript_11175/g.30892 Transcript_11175/m.30892 type:complete len:209 (+) Transcript_11175:300-926(+)